VASAFGGGEPPAGTEASPRTTDQARRQPPAVPAAGGQHAISASPAADGAPELPAGPSADTGAPAAAAVGSDPAVTAEAMTAMLAATLPSVNFGDPLGSADPLSGGDRAQADMPAVPQDLEAPSPNGREPAS
jgi:hypothetical protein